MKVSCSVLRTPAAATRIRIPAFSAPLRSVLNERHRRSALAYILIRVSPSDVNVSLRVNTQATLTSDGTFIIKRRTPPRRSSLPKGARPNSVRPHLKGQPIPAIFFLFVPARTGPSHCGPSCAARAYYTHLIIICQEAKSPRSGQSRTAGADVSLPCGEGSLFLYCPQAASFSRKRA